MATTSNTYTGNGSNKLFSITFPYIDKTDVDVYLNGTLQTITTQYSFANATTIEFVSAPSNGAKIYIQRTTANEVNAATFFAGSSIKASDLNDNFDQALYTRQELIDNNWNNTDDTIESFETWVSSDNYIATTQSIDQRIDYKIDTALTGDIFGSDGVTITDNVPGSGQITVGLGASSVDLDRIKDDDIITTAEQNAGSPVWTGDDTRIATIGALARRHDTLVQTSTPTGTSWQVGKGWLQNDSNNTYSVWDGLTWKGVASGGTFTTQPTVVYVDSVNGSDTNDGHRIINPMKTIKAAVASAQAGWIIKVAPGVYTESLPIDITVANLSIVGESQRSCFINPTPATETQIMFRCNSGTYIDGFTFAGLKASGTRGTHAIDNDATYGLPSSQGWVAGFYPGCTIKKSPFINNCTNFADSGINNAAFDPNNYSGTGGDTTSAPTGGGIIVDGSLPNVNSPLRSFVINEFTQVCLDGPGLLVCNNGYAQAVSFFGLFCHYHAKALSGGQINMEVGTTDFGRYGLIADGKSTTPIFTATANGAASAGATTFAINAPTTGAGWFGDANRPAINMLAEVTVSGTTYTYPILSSGVNGSGWNVEISNPNPTNTTINRGLTVGHASGATWNFYLRSMISTASHTMEYAGSGCNYNALPENGGVAVEANEAINRNNGKVWLTSTDQSGKFKVGDSFIVNQQTGSVTIPTGAVSTSLITDNLPRLGADLDVLSRNIFSSTGDIGIQDAFNTGVNLMLVRESSLATAYPVVTQYDIGTDPNQVPLNGYLGTMAFQDSAGVNLDQASITQINNVPLLTGGGLKFPPTQIPNADPNTLDDYEEGTWTVSFADALAGGNSSSTTGTGFYTKVGRLVTAIFEISNVSTTGLTSANPFCFSLPFVPLSTGPVGTHGASRLAGIAGSTNYTCPRIFNAASRGFFAFNSATNTYTNVLVSDVLGGTNLVTATISYLT